LNCQSESVEFGTEISLNRKLIKNKFRFPERQIGVPGLRFKLGSKLREKFGPAKNSRRDKKGFRRTFSKFFRLSVAIEPWIEEQYLSTRKSAEL
jgi:hypothetical protein